MTADTQPVLEAWKRQLMEAVAPYIGVARSRHDSVQVVLFLQPDGKIGDPKITVNTKQTEAAVDNARS